MASDSRIRYDLLECKKCAQRTWVIDQGEVSLRGFVSSAIVCSHEWWSKQTFFATDNGPGLVPTQVRDNDFTWHAYFGMATEKFEKTEELAKCAFALQELRFKAMEVVKAWNDLHNPNIRVGPVHPRIQELRALLTSDT